jgi:hypothetical protein
VAAIWMLSGTMELDYGAREAASLGGGTLVGWKRDSELVGVRGDASSHQEEAYRQTFPSSGAVRTFKVGANLPFLQSFL